MSEEDQKLFEEEMLEAFDVLLEDIKMGLEDGECVSVLNPVRLEMARFAWLAIQKVLRETGCDAKVTFKQLELAPDVCAISVEGAEIEMRNMEWFCRAAEFADNTEVYPLKGKKVRMTLPL